MMTDELIPINAIWRSGNYDYEIDAPQRQALIHPVADEDKSDNDDFGTFGKQSGTSTPDPCQSNGDEQVSETREHLPDGGSKTTRTNQDGTSVVTILNLNGVLNPEGNLVPGALEQDTKYNAQNKPTRTDSYDRSQNVVSTTLYDYKSGNPTHTTNFDANGDVKGTAAYSYDAQNRLTQVFHLDPQNNLIDRTVNTFTPNNLPRTSTTYDSNNQPTSKTVYAGGDTPFSVTYYIDGKPISVTRYDESGQQIGTLGPDGKPLGSDPATSTITTTPPNTQ
jgi:antitoxin component YwqK of YwqJK toxin-antitoxin module